MELFDLGRVFRWMGSPVGEHLDERLAHSECPMAATHRDVAIHSAEMMGVQSYLGEFGSGRPGRGDGLLFRNLIADTARPFLILDPRAGLHIVACNAAYANVSLTQRRRVVGKKLFEVFPDNPALPDADGVSNLYESLRRCAQSGRAHRMQLQRYDIRDAAGQFLKRHWRPVNSPIFDENGRLVFLVHHVDGAVEA